MPRERNVISLNDFCLFVYVTFCLDAKSNQKDQVQPDRSARLDGQLTAGIKAGSASIDLLTIPYNC